MNGRFLAGIVLGTIGLSVAGCSKGDDAALDNAAPKTTSPPKMPPPFPGKTVNKMGSLAGPNRGKGGIPGE